MLLSLSLAIYLRQYTISVTLIAPPESPRPVSDEIRLRASEGCLCLFQVEAKPCTVS